MRRSPSCLRGWADNLTGTFPADYSGVSQTRIGANSAGVAALRPAACARSTGHARERRAPGASAGQAKCRRIQLIEAAIERETCFFCERLSPGAMNRLCLHAQDLFGLLFCAGRAVRRRSGCGCLSPDAPYAWFPPCDGPDFPCHAATACGAVDYAESLVVIAASCIRDRSGPPVREPQADCGGWHTHFDPTT